MTIKSRKTGETGLSPLARGTPVNRRKRVLQYRFIPAGAGNTRKPPTITEKTTVYPRWRGEHAGVGLSDDTDAGLSPLARGTLLRAFKSASNWRFIPAGAGNTTLPNSPR